MDSKNEYLKWIEFAEKDYEAAKVLSKNVKPLLEIICFHCQQCAEKYLKAYIIQRNAEIKRTHNLEELLKTCTNIDKDFSNIIDSCIDLTDYAVETRYPYPFEIEKIDMLNAVKDMMIIRKFISEKLKDKQ